MKVQIGRGCIGQVAEGQGLGRLAGLLTLDGQRGHLFPWSAVALGLGISVYFALPAEPGPWVWAAAALALAALTWLAYRFGGPIPWITALCLVAAGFCLAGLRTHLVAAPVIEFRYFGPVQGRVVNVDRSASDAVRLTLDRVLLERMDPDETPTRVRISLHGPEPGFALEPGATVMATAHLSPPGGPVEPGGYDFSRQAWFAGLGAVGYTRTPVLLWASAAEGRAGLFIHRLRAAISGHVVGALPGRTGAFAAAVTTGDRSAMDEATTQALRDSNLSHLLAISGLHMGLLTGFIYGVLRSLGALIGPLALRWPVHRPAALGALAAGAAYLAISGGNVATERAFVMVAVMLLAVVFDRRALTMRSVALAAIVVLAFRPEALAGPGFQMSFSATIALIAVFAALRGSRTQSLPPVPRWVVALVISSAVAGFATGPFAAVHFNRVPHYGLIANILAVPVMGSVVMPACVLAAVLAPFGLSWVGLKIMGLGIDWILLVADRVAAAEGATSMVPGPSAAVLPLLAIGGLVLALWHGRGRLAGAAPLALAFVLWAGSERPVLLVSSEGGLVGLVGPEGRVLSKARGGGFAAESWLEDDGDPASQADAAARPGFGGQPGDLAFTLAGVEGRIVSGRNNKERTLAACAEADIVVTTAKARVAGDCLLLDQRALETTGPIAAWPGPDGLRLVTARDIAGDRPWSTWRDGDTPPALIAPRSGAPALLAAGR